MRDQNETIQQLRDLVTAFVDEREWQPYHDAKNLSMSIAIEAAELMEHFQWSRTDQLEELLHDEKKSEEIRDEIADIFCYLLSLTNDLKIDLAQALRDKLVKNAKKYPADKFRGNYYKPRDQLGK